MNFYIKVWWDNCNSVWVPYHKSDLAELDIVLVVRGINLQCNPIDESKEIWLKHLNLTYIFKDKLDEFLACQNLLCNW